MKRQTQKMELDKIKADLARSKASKNKEAQKGIDLGAERKSKIDQNLKRSIFEKLNIKK